MKNFFNFDERINAASKAALAKAKTKFDEIDSVAEYNQQKVLSAFINNRVQRTQSSVTVSPAALTLLPLHFLVCSVPATQCSALQELPMTQSTALSA